MRGWVIVVAVVGCLALGSAPAAAAELTSFELASPLVDASLPGGQLEKRRGAPKVNVLLPDGYRRDSERGYPVLWLLHGANGGTDSWLADIEKQAAGFPGIVVMPDGGKYGMYVDWWNDGLRGDPAWASFHLKVLRREIERRYPIRPGRRWHAIGGISMGGQGTLRYAAMLPGYFGSAAGMSAALPDMRSEEAQIGILPLALTGGPGVNYRAMFGPPAGAYALGNSAQTLASNLGHTRLYLTAGNGTNCPQDPVNMPSYPLDIVTEAAIHDQQEPFAAAARAAGADVTVVLTCGVHTFGVWDRAIPAVFEWGFFEPVAPRPRSWTYRTIATSGDMWDFRFRFAEPPAEVVQFERSGRRLAGAGAGELTVRGRPGCRFSVALPFERVLADACR